MVSRNFILALPLLALPAVASAQAAQHIPVLHATALSGDRVDLPDALKGHVAVLILSFSQASRDNVTAWFKALAADYRTSPKVLYYELPVLAGAPGFLRGMIVGKIRETVAVPAQPRFLPVLDREDEWKSAAGWSKRTPESDAWLLLVDENGTILSRAAAAAPTLQAYAELKREINSQSSVLGKDQN